MKATTVYCPHCWPSKRTGHLDIQLDYYFTKVIEFVELLSRPFSFFASRDAGPNRFSHRIWGWYLEFFSLLGLVRFEKEPDLKLMNIRSRVFYEEARRRGLDIAPTKLLGRKTYSNEFKLRYRGRNHYFESIPLTMRGTSFRIDNKYGVKRLLMEHGLPVPEGRVFTSKAKGMEYGRSLGFPLVVKPNTGSLAVHITCNILNEKALAEAIDIVQQYQPKFIVERFLSGGMHRGTVIDKKHLFICLRERANVVGDGVFTIRRLMEQKNDDPRRGEAFDASASLHKMPFDGITEKHLESQGLIFEYVPPAGQKIYLYPIGKLLPDRGNDIINFTGQAHPDNVELFLETARLLDTDLVGIDFVIPDITKSYKEQTSGILESNSVPYVDMHTNPSVGKPEPIVELIWDLALADLERL